MEQTYEPMYKNRIRGMRCGASGREIAKPISIKSTGCKSGGVVRKAVELTSGDLPCCLGNETEVVVRRPDRSAEVSRGHSVCWVAYESGGLKSLQRSDEGRCIQRQG